MLDADMEISVPKTEVMHAKIQALLSPVNRKDVEEMKQNGTLKHQCEHCNDAFPTASIAVPAGSLWREDRSTESLR